MKLSDPVKLNRTQPIGKLIHFAIALLITLFIFHLPHAAAEVKLAETLPFRKFSTGDLPSAVANRIGYFKSLVLGGFYGGSICSGALIAPNLAITAAHCLEHNSANPSVKFKSNVFYLPDGTQTKIVDSYALGGSSYNGSTKDLHRYYKDYWRDIEVLLLEDRVGDRLGWFEIFRDETDYNSSLFDFRLFGFPASGMLFALPAFSYTFGSHAAISGEVCEFQFLEQFSDGKKSYPIEKGKVTIETNCSSYHGMSGGPMLAQDRRSGVYRIAGVIKGGYIDGHSFITPTFQFKELEKFLSPLKSGVQFTSGSW